MIQMGRIKGYLATFFQKNKSGGVFFGQGIVHYEDLRGNQLGGGDMFHKLSRMEPDKLCQLMKYTTFAI